MKAVLLDASCIVALLDVAEPRHAECLAIVTSLPPPLVTCEAVIAESCHLLRHVDGANQAILEDVRRGVYQLPHVLAARAAEVATLLRKYADVPMDLADACLVDLAMQTGNGRILTLDGDFTIYRWGRNRPFELLIDI
jgi:predicted nucleic acid-binding protein